MLTNSSPSYLKLLLWFFQLWWVRKEIQKSNFLKRSLNQSHNEASCFQSHIFVEENLNWSEMICLSGKLLIGRGIIWYGFATSLYFGLFVLECLMDRESNLKLSPCASWNYNLSFTTFWHLLINLLIDNVNSCSPLLQTHSKMFQSHFPIAKVYIFKLL